MYLRRFPAVPTVAVLALLYFFVGKLGLDLATLHKSASPVWPAAGIAIAGILLRGYRVWPAVFIGAFCVNITTEGNVLTSLCIGAGNTLEALGAAALINHYSNGVQTFDRVQGVFKFALAVLIGSLIAPTIGATSLAVGGYLPWPEHIHVWTTWWLGDLTGALITAPLLILWSVFPGWKFDPRNDWQELLLMLVVISLGGAVFGGWLPISVQNYPVSFITAPLIVWTAFRFSQRVTALALFILSGIAIWGTLHGFGPFSLATPNESLLLLQFSTGLLTVTALALSSGMEERRRAVVAIEQQRTAVEAANRTKDNFIAMLSHELRTPLTPVIAALDALEAAPHSEETRSSLAMVRRNVELESQLIDDLLDLTRIARDKLQLRLEDLDAHAAIANVVEICRTEANARKLRVHLNLRAGAHWVRADAAKFHQIVWNLLKNAIKFTPEGGEIAITTGNPAPQSLTLVVLDNGIGMTPELMKRIFDPFEQADRSFQHGFGGLGLGLAISKSLAQAHGGALVAQSEGPERGSSFTLSFPTISPPTVQPARAEPRPASEARAFRILLVDDHLDTCTALERLLVRRGHLVATMHDMRSAMEAAARNPFDLLISDIALPDGSGTELMTYLRAMSNIRGIAISGFGMNGDIDKSLKAGFAEHLVKPLKIDRLDAAIARVMDGGGGADV